MGKHVSRRHLFMGTATVGGGLIVAAQAYGAAADVEEPAHPALLGTVAAVHLPDTVVIRSNGLHTAVFAAGAEFWRDAAVTLQAYLPGDEVGLFGGWDGERFIATRMESVYRHVDARVLGRNGDRLQLTGGSLVLTAASKAAGEAGLSRAAVDELRAGDHVVGAARWEPALRRLVAVRLNRADALLAG